MKPDWKDAPDWAQWLALSREGWWYWFSEKPRVDEYFEVWGVMGRPTTIAGRSYLHTLLHICVRRWRNTLEARP